MIARRKSIAASTDLSLQDKKKKHTEIDHHETHIYKLRVLKNHGMEGSFQKKKALLSG